jgi:glycosyltransferase involved in cell wall biosynthesis
MKVSIVTVVINAEEFIENCIKSVLQQDYGDIEYIVIDGKSTDRTLEIIQYYRQDIGVFLSEADCGMYDALNKGIGLATGDIIGILNADDFFASSNVISSIVKCFIDENCDAVYGNLNMMRRNNPGKTVRKWRSGPYKILDLKLGWMPAHPTFYIKRSIFKQYDVYRPEFGISADYELVLRFLYQYRIRAIFLNQLMVYMRSGGMSNGSFKKQLYTLINDFRALKENKVPCPFVAVLIKRIRKIGQYLELKEP